MLAACATPPLDRYLLQAERQADAETVRLRGSGGMLSPARTRAILDDLRKKSPDSSVLDAHLAVEQAVAGTPLTTGNKVTLLEDGARTYAAMLEAIRGARRHIHMETYIFEADSVGQEFAAALAERARAGVKVRLIYDAIGSMHTPKEFFADLAQSGVEVAAFNPVNPSAVLTAGVLVNNRDHRKLTVVDGRVAFLGGINISGVYGELSSDKGSRGSSAAGSSGGNEPFEKRPWRDTQARIEGPVVTDLQRAFLRQWAKVKKEDLTADRDYFPAIAGYGNQLVRAVASSPTEQAASALYVALISAIDSAQSEVEITNAYFVPHDELLRALEDAARRGVDVRLMLPSRTDSWLALHAAHSYYEDLLEAGVKIYERQERLLHSKTAIVDGVWTTVGSSNLDWRSLVSNDEINVVVLGPEFAAQMKSVFATDLADSHEITVAAWRARPPTDRLKEAAASLWARLL